MNETKHAPGPWNMGRGRVSSPDPTFWIVDVLNRTKTLRVARVAGVGRDEAEANARLIAAAPELLEYLKIMVYWTESGTPPTGSMPPAHLVNTKAVIAKATGK